MMTRPKSSFFQGRWTREEKELRSKLTQLLHSKALLRGTLLVRSQTCGKETCRCTRGERHVCEVLVAKEGGKLQQLYIPKEYEARVRVWVDSYKRIGDLLEKISRLYWEKIKKREL